jgi:HK97 family phage prohead protease
MERKFCSGSFKAAPDGTISGYATTYQPPEDYDAYGDIIAPGAFAEQLDGVKKLPMRNEHNGAIGIWRDFEDDPTGKQGEKGLIVRGKISDTVEGRDVKTLIKDEVIEGLSIGYEVLESKTHDGVMTRWGFPVREILKGRIFEVSPTANPANTNARLLKSRSARRITYLATKNRRRAPGHQTKGAALIAALEAGIDALVADGMERDDVLAAMAEEAGVLPSTVDEILGGMLDEVELEKLQGFARALGLAESTLIDAAAADGFDPSSVGDDDDQVDDTEGEAAAGCTCGGCTCGKAAPKTEGSDDAPRMSARLDDITRGLDAAIKWAKAL